MLKINPKKKKKKKKKRVAQAVANTLSIQAPCYNKEYMNDTHAMDYLEEDGALEQSR